MEQSVPHADEKLKLINACSCFRNNTEGGHLTAITHFKPAAGAT